MASIPILAAVVSAIVIPVVGTGIYYSVKPSKEETTNQQQERTPKLPERSLHNPNSQIQNIADEYGVTFGRITTRPGDKEKSREMDNLIKDAQKRKEEALSNLNDTLSTGNIRHPFGNASHTSSYAGSHSTIGTRLSR